MAKNIGFIHSLVSSILSVAEIIVPIGSTQNRECEIDWIRVHAAQPFVALNMNMSREDSFKRTEHKLLADNDYST